MKLNELKIKIPVQKPRDPNQAILAAKKNAGGPMRNKKREQRTGDTKHKGRKFDMVEEQALKLAELTVEGRRHVYGPGDMTHPFSVKVLKKGPGKWPALRGEIYEKDVLIGTFSRRAMQDGYIPPIEYKFRTERAKNRFDDFADSLSIEETIEALLPL